MWNIHSTQKKLCLQAHNKKLSRHNFQKVARDVFKFISVVDSSALFSSGMCSQVHTKSATVLSSHKIPADSKSLWLLVTSQRKKKTWVQIGCTCNHLKFLRSLASSQMFSSEVQFWSQSAQRRNLRAQHFPISLLEHMGKVEKKNTCQIWIFWPVNNDFTASMWYVGLHMCQKEWSVWRRIAFRNCLTRLNLVATFQQVENAVFFNEMKSINPCNDKRDGPEIEFDTNRCKHENFTRNPGYISNCMVWNQHWYASVICGVTRILLRGHRLCKNIQNGLRQRMYVSRE